MTALFNRWLPCLTLATWSGVLLTFYFTGRIKLLVVPIFQTYALIGGILLALLALVFLIFPADASCCSSAECGHSLSRYRTGKLLTFGILVVPIAVAAFFSPEAFSANMVKNRAFVEDVTALGGKPRLAGLKPPEYPLPTKDGSQGADTAPPAPENAPGQPGDGSSRPPGGTPAPAAVPATEMAAMDYLDKNAEGVPIVEVLDMLYAAQDTVLRQEFDGKRVELVGQFMPAPTNNPKGTRFKAVRMFMTCCAADARPIATLVETEKLPEFAEMTWVRITGKATFPVENGRRVAVVVADKVEKTEPPEEANLF